MDRAVYTVLCAKAIEEFESLIAIEVDAEDIVAIMSEDVFWAATRYEGYWNVNFNIEELILHAKFNGCDVGVIRERDKTGMFRFAVRGGHHLNSMGAGTLLVVDSDDGAPLLYEVVAPPTFSGVYHFATDTGMTVAFGIAEDFEERATTAAAETVADMLANRFTFTVSSGIRTDNPIFHPTGYPAMEPILSEYQWIPGRYEYFRRPGKPKTGSTECLNANPNKQAEVEPDTAALDEFLSGFKVLKSAT